MQFDLQRLFDEDHSCLIALKIESMMEYYVCSKMFNFDYHTSLDQKHLNLKSTAVPGHGKPCAGALPSSPLQSFPGDYLAGLKENSLRGFILL